MKFPLTIPVLDLNVFICSFSRVTNAPKAKAKPPLPPPTVLSLIQA